MVRVPSEATPRKTLLGSRESMGRAPQFAVGSPFVRSVQIAPVLAPALAVMYILLSDAAIQTIFESLGATLRSTMTPRPLAPVMSPEIGVQVAAPSLV